MTNEELKDLIAENRRRAQERHEKAVQLLQAKFPEVEVEGLLVTGDEYEKNFHINNREYIHVDTINRYVWKSQSPLAMSVDLKEQLGHSCEIVDLEKYDRTFLISGRYTESVWLNTYHFKTGNRVKGERSSRKLYTTAKGQYFEYRGQRVYI